MCCNRSRSCDLHLLRCIWSKLAQRRSDAWPLSSSLSVAERMSNPHSKRDFEAIILNGAISRIFPSAHISKRCPQFCQCSASIFSGWEVSGHVEGADVRGSVFERFRRPGNSDDGSGRVECRCRPVFCSLMIRHRAETSGRWGIAITSTSDPTARQHRAWQAEVTINRHLRQEPCLCPD